uniref:Uncharacterized protein n=1 Tax=Lepeophtheirus salmonis TaxID=72036 RepID=A0A0K2UEI6_LEPSM
MYGKLDFYDSLF